MRKGFLLVEILVVLVVLAAMSVPLARLSTTSLRDIPWSYRMIASNTSVLSALKQIRKDVNAAEKFPKSFDAHTTNSETLLIRLKEDTICYRLKDGEIVRWLLADTAAGSDEKTASWPVPKAKIEWKVWRKDDRGYAVEVRTCIEQECGDRLEKRLANSHLYFADDYKEENQK